MTDLNNFVNSLSARQENGFKKLVLCESVYRTGRSEVQDLRIG